MIAITMNYDLRNTIQLRCIKTSVLQNEKKISVFANEALSKQATV